MPFSMTPYADLLHPFILVYPSLESEEDNPVFKSRSKKRKNSDDTPYSPTGKDCHVPECAKLN